MPSAANRLTDVESIELVESGPHRAALRVVRRFRASTVTQTYVLAANAPRLDIETQARLARPARAPAHADPGGGARRARHLRMRQRRGDPADPPATRAGTRPCTRRRRTASSISASPASASRSSTMPSTATTCCGNVLGMSLLRAPVYPDPLADEGTQSFTYALYPHAGDWHEGGVREEAEDSQSAAAHSPRDPASRRRPRRRSQPTGIPAAISGLKRAEDGNGLVFRVYEPAGRRGDFAIAAPGWQASPVTLMEEPQGARRRPRPDALRGAQLAPDASGVTGRRHAPCRRPATLPVARVPAAT